MTTRTERDSMGELQVPTDALYQAQTQRAVQNFQLSGLLMPTRFIQAMLAIKAAAAAANQQLGLLPAHKAEAIITVAKQQLSNTDMQQYPVDVFQTGSGTSSNMNVNEVLATLASQQLNEPVSPNDDINLGQSSNDVVPTAIQLSSVLALEQQLLPALTHLISTLQQKEQQIGHQVKTGRTHLMDAMPVTFGQVLSGWQAQLQHTQQQLLQLQDTLRQLPQGG
ncbi:MAG: aspartate ammonia-lyase, partial [Alkalimonas sp.]|nr:aspartate ammonia-lyase [Alkalimonas sp.]